MSANRGDLTIRVATGEEGLVAGHRVRPGELVALVGGTPAGLANVHAHFYGHRFIDLLVVAERHRRRGIATALIAACAEGAPTAKLFTSTNTSNVPAQTLFERVGFRVCGSIENLDEGDPEIVFFKAL